MGNNVVIGVDFGTDSVRALVVDTQGAVAASAVAPYPRWKKGLYCDPARNLFRQHPLDYTEGLTTAVTRALEKAGVAVAGRVRGLSIDTTGSTPAAVDQTGTPLSLLPEFQDDPDGMFILWKDHTGVAEAEEINAACAARPEDDYVKYSGGVYSSEWFWSKILHTLRANEKIRAHAFSWVEHCDWISGLLCGNTDPLTLKRSRCAAGHKALWHASWGGLPSEEFLSSLDPLLAGVRDRLFTETFTSDRPMGTISSEWAERLGLPPDTVVGVGAFDAHMGAVGGQITPYTLSKVMGTSTCDMLVAPTDHIGDKLIRGICGQVDGSIIPGMMGLEAGQSSFGDVYAWFADLLSWPLASLSQKGLVTMNGGGEPAAIILEELTRAAKQLPAGDGTLFALDWLNGRRTPFADQNLKAGLYGLSLGSTAPKVFRALVEATACGARKIVECFTGQGIPIKSVIALGGVAKKSPYIMQTIADVLGTTIKVARSDETCALGAAMFAAVASGLFPSVEEAQQGMGAGFEAEFVPDAGRKKEYDTLYARYNALGSFVEKNLR